MKKLTKKSSIILYGCSGLGVNMLNLIVGSYLCSALLVGGFVDHIESWTYLNRDLVIAGLWGGLIVAAKIIDGLIDLPLSHFVDNLKAKWGKRKTAIVMGFIPMIAAYLLFLVPVDPTASILNTIWFGGMLLVFYTAYTLTMITYYATFAEVTEKPEDISLLSNTKSVCDVAYFSLGYALVPAFVSMGINIRIVALLFLPLSLTMLIPLFTLKENDGQQPSHKPQAKPSFGKSLMFTLQDKPYIKWLCTLFVMNIGLQLFLSGINEYFSTTGLNMTFIMASCFVPVPLTILLYNKVTRKFGLGVAYRYILLVYSLGMGLMGLCRFIPDGLLFPFAIGCSLIVSFSIGAFFSVTYCVPSNRAAARKGAGDTASSMYFAVQGLFEGTSAGIASGVILVYLKQSGHVNVLTLVVAAACMTAFALSFLLPKSITQIGKVKK
ncbi:MAG: hypothetical protein E7466_00030 [Ruminococcaceae bacterium]|nr:hypothetical protein [Oscillospiraceae bacterium]